LCSCTRSMNPSIGRALPATQGAPYILATIGPGADLLQGICPGTRRSSAPAAKPRKPGAKSAILLGFAPSSFPRYNSAGTKTCPPYSIRVGTKNVPTLPTTRAIRD
jgi:hypothetical protein